MVHNNKIVTGKATKPAASSRPTIKDVAENCGVHPSTVSRALSPAMSHLVAPEVAKRIRAAAAALGYQVNVTAAGLRTGRSGLVGAAAPLVYQVTVTAGGRRTGRGALIGVLAPDTAAPGFPPILSGVTETLNA